MIEMLALAAGHIPAARAKISIKPWGYCYYKSKLPLRLCGMFIF